MSGFDGRLLKELRSRKGLSQDELAGTAGISVRCLQRLEGNKNQTRKPQPATLDALAGALGCSRADLCQPSTLVPKVRLAITEDETIVRWALREALRQADDIEVVGEAGTAAGTFDMIERERPDVLLLDINLPDRSGFDVLTEMRHMNTTPAVVILTYHTEPSYAARAIAAGAHGWLNKCVEPDELLAAIRAVSRGEQVIPPGVEELLIPIPSDGHPARALTAREQQVMEMLAGGMTIRAIAEHLEISIKTVDTHRGHVLKKLGLRNNQELTLFAVKYGYSAL